MHTVVRYAFPFEGPESLRVVAVESDSDRATWHRLRAVAAEMGPKRAPSMYSRPAAGGKWVVHNTDNNTVEIWESYTEVVGVVITSVQITERKIAAYAVIKADDGVIPAPPAPPAPAAPPPPRPTATAQSLPYMGELHNTIARRKKRM